MKDEQQSILKKRVLL